MKELKFAFYAIKKNIKNSAGLRTSFLMNIFGMAINNLAFVFLWVYFVKSVGVIGGWTTYDIVALNGFVALVLGITFSVLTGIRKLPEYISSGSFDKFMLSPKNILLRVATSSFNPAAAGDIIFGIICLIVYGFLIHISILQILLMIVCIIFASIIFFSLATIIYTLSFYVIDGTEITEGVFNLFFTPSMFNGGAFHGVIRFIFTFIIPSLLIGTIPVETIKNISFQSLIMIIVFSFIWFFIAIKFFKRAIRKYESSNLITFGQ